MLGFPLHTLDIFLYLSPTPCYYSTLFKANLYSYLPISSPMLPFKIFSFSTPIFYPWYFSIILLRNDHMLMSTWGFSCGGGGCYLFFIDLFTLYSGKRRIFPLMVDFDVCSFSTWLASLIFIKSDKSDFITILIEPRTSHRHCNVNL